MSKHPRFIETPLSKLPYFIETPLPKRLEVTETLTLSKLMDLVGMESLSPYDLCQRFALFGSLNFVVE